MKTDMAKFFALVRNEMLVCQRLSRWSLFLWVVLLICSTKFIFLTWYQMSLSGSNPLLGFISPRYFVCILGDSFVFLTCLGVILFAFDVFRRDRSERIYEVIYSKPISDLEWCVGRVISLIMVVGIPILILLTLFLSYGLMSELFSIPFGEPIEPWSMVSLIILDLIPNLVLFCSITLFLILSLKSRLLALIISLFCVFGLFWINNRLPVAIGDLLHTVTGNVIIPSELVPTLATPEILFNRMALLVISCGLVFFTGAIFPRNVPDRSVYTFVGVGSITTGMVVFLLMIGFHSLERGHIARWVEVHNAHFDAVVFPDIHHLEGVVDIKPGRSMTADFTLQVSIPKSTEELEFVAFSFNPGFRISHLSAEGEAIEGDVFRHGLLRIPKRYFSSAVVELRVQARGRPNQRFAYLDAVVRVASVAGPSVNQLRLLGTENSIFRSNFVVLVPGIKWYPTAGTATREDDWVHRRKDFFTVDLKVVVPRGWIVAGPSKRRLSSQSSRAIYQFKRSNPVPELALVGSRFEVASMDESGLEIEILYSRVHRQSIEQLSSLVSSIRDWVRNELSKVRSAGFEFVEERLSLVEVPSVLRVYGGGGRMDTTMFPPGMMLVREHTLPTLHVPSLLLPAEFRGASSSRDRMLSRALTKYFTKQPMYESNLLYYMRNIVTSQIGAFGSAAPAINTALDLIVPQLLLQSEIYFDFDVAINPQVVDLSSFSVLNIVNVYLLLREDYQDVIARRERLLNSSSVMSAVETDADSESDVNTSASTHQRALRLRAMAINDLLIDVLGKEAVAATLIELIRRFRGTNFGYMDFLDTLNTEGNELDVTLRDWFSASKLPGFKASLMSYRELKHHDTGLPQYEAEVLLQNGESANGSVRIWATYDRSAVWSSIPKLPVFVEGNTTLAIVLRSNSLKKYVWIEPYLSLNRMSLRVDLPFEHQDEVPANVGRGQTTIHSITVLHADQIPQDETNLDSSIIIDDLDEGFSVSKQLKTPSLVDLATVFFGERARELDRGLPLFDLMPTFPSQGKWERKTDATAHGKYRKTFAISRADPRDKQVFARFAATLPKTGRWQLDYYLARGDFEEVFEYQGIRRISAWELRVGPVDLVIESANSTETNAPQPTDAESGWYTVGVFDLNHKDVTVLVSNKPQPNYDAVIADAIRWTPVDVSQ